MLTNRNRSRRWLAYDPYVTLTAYVLPLTRRTNLFQIPTFLIFRDGKKIDKLVGADPNKLDVPYFACQVILLAADQSVAIAPERSDPRVRKVQTHFSHRNNSPKPYNVDFRITVEEINSYTQFKEIVCSAASERSIAPVR